VSSESPSAPTLGHFSAYSLTAEWFRLAGEERRAALAGWLAALRRAAPRVELYQLFPTRANADLLVWSTLPVPLPDAPAAFFSGAAHATGPLRHLVSCRDVLWGLTRPSAYARGRSQGTIDPLAGERRPYLVVYPFSKTADWYLKSQDARQGMMNEHIRVGREHPGVRQLLLYSFGLQDQEFVVVYEVDDLTVFSELVQALRGTEGRRFTARDAPVYTGIHRSDEEAAELWG
jgi:chlorite dismutase